MMVFFYQDENNVLYRFLFADSEPLQIGTTVKFVAARENTSILCSTEDGEICVLRNDAREKEKIGKFDESAYMECISNDAMHSAWLLADSDKSIFTPVINYGDDRQRLSEYDSKYSGFFSVFSKDEKLLVIGSYHSDVLYISSPSEEVIKVKLPNDLSGASVYTNKGLLENINADQIEFLYVAVDGENYSNIYCIDMNGEKERVASDVSSYFVCNDCIIFADEDGTLYYSKLLGANIEEKNKIARDVEDFEVSDNGKYVYYVKNISGNECTLYAYKIGEETSVKISSSAGYNSESYFPSMCLELSTKGDTVYYFQDIETADSYSRYGALYSWTYSNEQHDSEKIASDVIVNYMTSLLASGRIDSSFFYFRRFSCTKVKSDTTYSDTIYDLMMYQNGEITKKNADMIY